MVSRLIRTNERTEILEDGAVRIRGILLDFPLRDRKLFMVGYSATGIELAYVNIPLVERPEDDTPPTFVTKFYSTKVIEEWSSWKEAILTVKAQFWHPQSLRCGSTDLALSGSS